MPGDTNIIYEEAFSASFNHLKYYRNQWNFQPYESDDRPSMFYSNVWSSESVEFRFVLEESRKTTVHALASIIIKLLENHGYDVEIVPFEVENSILLQLEKTREIYPVHQSSNDEVFAIIIPKSQKRNLFIFKEYGIGNRFPEGLVNALRTRYLCDGYCYISWVDKNAYSEIINHNDNESDLSRGTGTYPLPFFFQLFFGINEYEVFLNHYTRYQQSVRDYFGLSIVKTLRPNVMFSYRKDILDILLSYDFGAGFRMFSACMLSDTQKPIVDQQFLDAGYCHALMGHCSFAKCFMTAEWLYESLHESTGAIDLTAISMGYFKAIEQFMYDFVGLHTCEKDKKRRNIHINNNWMPLTDVSHLKKKKKFTLGILVEFLKNSDNHDLLRPEIDSETIKLLCDVLSKATDQRNGHFHKDNINDWDKIEKDRALAYVLFYLILGTYHYSSDEIACLGIDDVYRPDDREKLCGYIHNRASKHDKRNIPIFYLNGTANTEDYYRPCQDENITYNEYGDPNYSGIYMKRIGQGTNAKHYDMENLPGIIYEGILTISRAIPISITSSGPLKLIYCNDHFLLEENGIEQSSSQ